MSKFGDSLDTTQEREHQQYLHEARQFVGQSQSASRAEKHCAVRENVLEPLASLTELEVTPSTVHSDESVRTITPPYLKRFALPKGTQIDRNVTRGRGSVAESERFSENINTDPIRETSEEKEKEGYDPSIVHSPLRSGANPQTAVEGGATAPLDIIIIPTGEPQQTGASEPKEATGVKDSVPSFLSTG